jgi:iron complex transport system substrate-binding protein
MRHQTLATLSGIVGLSLLATACAGDTESDTASDGTSETRTVEHLAGATEVPADPQRIVTTTDQNALLPLLELGVRPVGSAGLLDTDGSTSFRRTEGFDTSGITFTGPYGEPNLEKVLSLAPDLVVGYDGDASYYEDLAALAPTVLVQVFDRPLTDGLEQFAEVVGREEQAAELRAAYETRIADLRDGLGDRLDSLSLTVVEAGDPGTFYRSDVGQAMGTVVDDLGVLRVDAQAEDTGEEATSLERLGDRSADVVLVVDYSGEQSEPDVGTTALLDSPLYQRLPAVRAEQGHVVDGTQVVGAAWARMDAFLDVLEDHLLDARDDVVDEGAA